jgi:hypothetical protein
MSFREMILEKLRTDTQNTHYRKKHAFRYHDDNDDDDDDDDTNNIVDILRRTWM